MSRRLDAMEPSSPPRAPPLRGSGHAVSGDWGGAAAGGWGDSRHADGRAVDGRQAKLSAAELEELEYEEEMMELEREGALPPELVAQRQAQRAMQATQRQQSQRRAEGSMQGDASRAEMPPPPLRRTTPFGNRSRPPSARLSPHSTPHSTRPSSGQLPLEAQHRGQYGALAVGGAVDEADSTPGGSQYEHVEPLGYDQMQPPPQQPPPQRAPKQEQRPPRPQQRTVPPVRCLLLPPPPPRTATVVRSAAPRGGRGPKVAVQRVCLGGQMKSSRGRRPRASLPRPRRPRWPLPCLQSTHATTTTESLVGHACTPPSARALPTTTATSRWPCTTRHRLAVARHLPWLSLMVTPTER